MGSFLSLEVGLLLVSIAIAFFSYQGQLRTQMREAVEQLDDLHLSSTKKGKFLLHDYRFLKRETTVSFRTLDAPYSGGQGSTVQSPPLDRLPDGAKDGEENEQEQFKDFIRGIGSKDELKSVTEVDEQKYEILITINSIEPIAVRKVADEIGVHFNDKYSKHY